MMSVSRLFLTCKILCSPLDILFSLLIFILNKEMGATTFQVAVMASVKPVSALSAYYVSAQIFNKPQRIRYYLIINTVVGSALCLFFPFVQNVWFYIISYAIFMTCMRAVYPAWIELLKTKLKDMDFAQTISRGISINYLVMIFLPFLIGSWMDLNEGVWKYAFIVCAGLTVLASLFMLTADVQVNKPIEEECLQRNAFLDPLRQGWAILTKNRAFAHYQFLFCLGGVGIIASQPVMPTFFMENLAFSYSELTFAFSVCKGVAYILTSPRWTKMSRQISIYLLNSYVDLFSCLFFALLLVSNLWTGWAFVAYLCYGSMLAGCEMSWNISGPYYSKDQESTIFSSINLVILGLRGCLCPFLGHLLFSYTNSIIVFEVAAAVCFVALLYGTWLNSRYKVAYS